MQSIYLNLIPGTVKPVINLSQFDEGREFSLTIINGASAADLTGATVTISGRKKDDTAFSYGTSDYVKGNPVVSVVGNVVTIRNTMQMAILAGDVLATLSISKTASDVSTLDFIIKVQENPLDGVDISETEIPGIVSLAEEQVEEAEAWAKGTKGGNPVTSDDPQYDNNAKYWSDRAAQYATGALHYVGAVTFANIPTSGMSNGDMYNITTDFTTDSRFIEGAGISCKAGTDIAWVASVGKWDLPLVVPTTPAVTVDNAMNTSSTNPLENRVITNALAAGRISFGVDAQGNWGYKKDGADTVIPFRTDEVRYSNGFPIMQPVPTWDANVEVELFTFDASKPPKYVFINVRTSYGGVNHDSIIFYDHENSPSYYQYCAAVSDGTGQMVENAIFNDIPSSPPAYIATALGGNSTRLFLEKYALYGLSFRYVAIF